MAYDENQFDDDFENAGREFNVDPSVLKGVAKTESGFNPSARSKAGALGLMQFMPATAHSLNVNPYEPRSAIYGAAHLLRQNLDRYGNIDDALSAYNAGTNKARWNNPETQAYHTKVLGHALHYASARNHIDTSDEDGSNEDDDGAPGGLVAAMTGAPASDESKSEPSESETSSKPGGLLAAITGKDVTFSEPALNKAYDHSPARTPSGPQAPVFSKSTGEQVHPLNTIQAPDSAAHPAVSAPNYKGIGDIMYDGLSQNAKSKIQGGRRTFTNAVSSALSSIPGLVRDTGVETGLSEGELLNGAAKLAGHTLGYIGANLKPGTDDGSYIDRSRAYISHLADSAAKSIEDKTGAFGRAMQDEDSDISHHAHGTTARIVGRAIGDILPMLASDGLLGVAGEGIKGASTASRVAKNVLKGNGLAPSIIRDGAVGAADSELRGGNLDDAAENALVGGVGAHVVGKLASSAKGTLLPRILDAFDPEGNRVANASKVRNKYESKFNNMSESPEFANNDTGAGDDSLYASYGNVRRRQLPEGVSENDANVTSSKNFSSPKNSNEENTLAEDLSYLRNGEESVDDIFNKNHSGEEVHTSIPGYVIPKALTGNVNLKLLYNYLSNVSPDVIKRLRKNNDTAAYNHLVSVLGENGTADELRAIRSNTEEQNRRAYMHNNSSVEVAPLVDSLDSFINDNKVVKSARRELKPLRDTIRDFAKDDGLATASNIHDIRKEAAEKLSSPTTSKNAKAQAFLRDVYIPHLDRLGDLAAGVGEDGVGRFTKYRRDFASQSRPINVIEAANKAGILDHTNGSVNYLKLNTFLNSIENKTNPVHKQITPQELSILRDVRNSHRFISSAEKEGSSASGSNTAMNNKQIDDVRSALAGVNPKEVSPWIKHGLTAAGIATHHVGGTFVASAAKNALKRRAETKRAIEEALREGRISAGNERLADLLIHGRAPE